MRMWTEKVTIDKTFLELEGKTFSAQDVSRFLNDLDTETELVGNLTNSWAYDDSLIEVMIKLKVADDRTTTRAIIKGKNYDKFSNEFFTMTRNRRENL